MNSDLPTESNSEHLVYQPAIPVPRGKVAIWLFLSTEIMFFTALIGTYIVLRFGVPAGSWPSPSQVGVVEWLGALNTFVLICSSVTIVFALEAARADNARRARQWLAATTLLVTSSTFSLAVPDVGVSKPPGNTSIVSSKSAGPTPPPLA